MRFKEVDDDEYFVTDNENAEIFQASANLFYFGELKDEKCHNPNELAVFCD